MITFILIWAVSMSAAKRAYLPALWQNAVFARPSFLP
jgi:hypothetical protein